MAGDVSNAAIFAGPLLGAALLNATAVATASIIAGIARWVRTVPFSALPYGVWATRKRQVTGCTLQVAGVRLQTMAECFP